MLVLTMFPPFVVYFINIIRHVLYNVNINFRFCNFLFPFYGTIS
nr:MAG TPA: hypothetical protein [Caudoviricetes sp.]